MDGDQVPVFKQSSSILSDEAAAKQADILRAIGLVVWRYGEFVFLLSQTIWLLMADPSGQTYGPAVTADLDFVKLVNAFERLSAREDLSEKRRRQVPKLAKDARGINTERVKLLHAWFGMVTVDEHAEPQPRIIRPMPAGKKSPGLVVHVATPDVRDLVGVSDRLEGLFDELGNWLNSVARELGIGDSR